MTIKEKLNSPVAMMAQQVTTINQVIQEIGMAPDLACLALPTDLRQQLIQCSTEQLVPRAQTAQVCQVSPLSSRQMNSSFLPMPRAGQLGDTFVPGISS